MYARTNSGPLPFTPSFSTHQATWLMGECVEANQVNEKAKDHHHKPYLRENTNTTRFSLSRDGTTAVGTNCTQTRVLPGDIIKMIPILEFITLLGLHHSNVLLDTLASPDQKHK